MAWIAIRKPARALIYTRNRRLRSAGRSCPNSRSFAGSPTARIRGEAYVNAKALIFPMDKAAPFASTYRDQLIVGKYCFPFLSVDVFPEFKPQIDHVMVVLVDFCEIPVPDRVNICFIYIIVSQRPAQIL